MSPSLIRWIAIAALAAGLVQAPLFAMQEAPQGGDPNATAEQAAERQALGFLGYLDQGRFADSYAYTGVLLRAQLDRDAYAAQIQKTRAGVGALLGRDPM